MHIVRIPRMTAGRDLSRLITELEYCVTGLPHNAMETCAIILLLHGFITYFFEIERLEEKLKEIKEKTKKTRKPKMNMDTKSKPKKKNDIRKDKITDKRKKIF